jgi:hypothetical protein
MRSNRRILPGLVLRIALLPHHLFHGKVSVNNAVAGSILSHIGVQVWRTCQHFWTKNGSNWSIAHLCCRISYVWSCDEYEVSQLGVICA